MFPKNMSQIRSRHRPVFGFYLEFDFLRFSGLVLEDFIAGFLVV